MEAFLWKYLDLLQLHAPIPHHIADFPQILAKDFFIPQIQL